MKGLLIKDLLTLKRQGKVLLVMLGFYTVYSTVFKNISMLSAMTVLICAMMPITTMSYDEKCKWDKYALSMPIPRKTIVLSKYVFGVMLDVVGLVLVIPLSLLIVSFSKEMVLKDVLLTAVAVAGAALLFLAIVLPLLYKFGVEKGRILMLLVIFIPAVIFMLMHKYGIPAPSEQTIKLLMYASPVILIAVLLISAAISVGIYNRKEF